MRELFLQPEIHSFNNFKEFVDFFRVCQNDLILTDEPILPAFQADIPERIKVVCLGKYGFSEPSDVMFDALQEDLSKYDYDRMIAVGGGSVMDMAKALCVADGRNMDELFGAPPDSLKRTKTLLCLPTTCGTGSEVTVTAVFDRTRKQTKMGITNPALGTDYAILIPSLLDSLPPSVFGASSIDALIHTIESYLNIKQATVTSQMFARESILMILPIYRDIREKGLSALKKHLASMQLASNYAGIAIANALPSASHAMSYPFAGKFHRPHGEACYVFLNVTLQKYLADVKAGKVSEKQITIWKNFMDILAKGLDTDSDDDSILLKELDALLSVVLTRKRLKDYGASPEDCVEFGKNCFFAQQRLLSCSFSTFTEDELIKAFESVY